MAGCEDARACDGCLHSQPVIMSLPGPGQPQHRIGASSVTITRPGKTLESVNMESRAERERAAKITRCNVRDWGRGMSRCLGISANMWLSADVDVNVELGEWAH